MAENPYLFYEIMSYPLPRQREFFAYGVGQEPRGLGFVEGATWSTIDERQEEYVAYTKKRLWIWKYIPFIEAVYVANSMTFNGLHDGSDIDLFIVTNVKRLRSGRLFSVIVLWLLQLKRTAKKAEKKFCLSFTVSRDAVNLQEIKLSPYDPYLIYRIAHLVPIYFEFEDYELNIYKENNRIGFYLPNHPLQQIVDLGIGLTRGMARPRKILEKILAGYLGDFLERLIKIIRLPIVLYKRKKLGAIGKECIISDTMLKFHYDKRKLYALKRKLAKK